MVLRKKFKIIYGLEAAKINTQINAQISSAADKDSLVRLWEFSYNVVTWTGGEGRGAPEEQQPRQSGRHCYLTQCGWETGCWLSRHKLDPHHRPSDFITTNQQRPSKPTTLQSAQKIS